MRRKITSIGIFLVGLLLLGFVYDSKYRSHSIRDGIENILLIIYLILFSIVVISDYFEYKRQKKYFNFLSTLLGFFIIVAMILIKVNIRKTFEKPSLIKIYYDGDYNGVSIDFKRDGTYIVDNFSIGFNAYTYGKYHLYKDSIFLDTDMLGSELLLINEEKKMIFFHSKDKNNLEFRIIEDNRKK